MTASARSATRLALGWALSLGALLALPRLDMWAPPGAPVVVLAIALLGAAMGFARSAGSQRLRGAALSGAETLAAAAAAAVCLLVLAPQPGASLADLVTGRSSGLAEPQAAVSIGCIALALVVRVLASRRRARARLPGANPRHGGMGEL